jgi:hypothetical protein
MVSTRRLAALFGFVVICTAIRAEAQVQVGYVTLTPDSGTTSPVGSVLFSYTNAQGVLVSQAGVGASAPIRSGRTFVDESGAQMGMAFANPSDADASVILTLRAWQEPVTQEYSETTVPPERLRSILSEWPSTPPAISTSPIASITAFVPFARRSETTPPVG